MYYKSQIIILTITFCFVMSCGEKFKQQTKVRYEVRLAYGNTVGINCYNDYYHQTKSLKEISYKSDYNYFFSSRIAYVNEDYFIKVTPLNLISDTINIVTSVFIADTLREQKTSKILKEPLIISGKIKP